MAKYREKIERRLRDIFCWYLFRSSEVRGGYPKNGYLTIFFDYESYYGHEKYALPSRRGIEWILKVEEENAIRSTFNIVGKLILDDSKLAEKLVEGGHELACHSYEHKSMSRMRYEEIVNDLHQCQETCQRELSCFFKGFRSPKSDWNFMLLKALCETGFVWNAENDSASFPYIIKKGIANSLWRFPVYVDDYYLFETLGMNSDQVLGELNRIVQDVSRKKRYASIGFHPWVLGKEKERLLTFETFISGLSTRSDIKIVPFYDMLNFHVSHQEERII